MPEMSTSLWLIVLSLVAQVIGSNLIIDVSHYNGKIDWEKVKAAGVILSIAKASEGNHLHDDKFVENWEGMKRNNIQSGAYHYFRGQQTPESQVENLKKILQKVNFDVNKDILAIDVEEKNNENVSKENMADNLKSVLDLLKIIYKNVYIYTSKYYWDNKVAWRNFDFSVYKLWVAHYTTKDQPDIPTTWSSKKYALWQYTDSGRVNGINGNVDMSRV